jgi:pyridoxal phosphate enzyme (YggS family)
MSSLDDSLQARIDAVRARIDLAARRAGRDPGSIALLAVSKGAGAEAIAAACRCGQAAFGESYLQEAVGKLDALAADPATSGASWHFIGPIQSNKTRAIAERFDWVQSVDRLAIAQRLSAQRPADRAPLSVLLQVNISDEATKHGVAASAVAPLAAEIAALPRLALRGLMAIPAPRDAAALQADFERMRALLEELNASGLALDTLSLGMSADLEAAIAAGSTMVRIGTAIFGSRA